MVVRKIEIESLRVWVASLDGFSFSHSWLADHLIVFLAFGVHFEPKREAQKPKSDTKRPRKSEQIAPSCFVSQSGPISYTVQSLYSNPHDQ